MPASRGYINVLQRERLEAHLASGANRGSEHLKVDHLFEEFKSLERPGTELLRPSSVSLASLDDGRVSLRDAMNAIGWSTSTNLEIEVRAGAVTILEVEDGKTQISANQNRCLIPLSIRRLLNWDKKAQLLVISYTSPINHVLVYETSLVLEKILRKV